MYASACSLLSAYIHWPCRAGPILLSASTGIMIHPLARHFFALRTRPERLRMNASLFFRLSALVVALFLGGWQSPIGILPGVFWFLVKMYFLIFCVVWIRWTFPRTQFYGLLNLSWKILIPLSLFTLILSSAMLKLFK